MGLLGWHGELVTCGFLSFFLYSFLFLCLLASFFYRHLLCSNAHSVIISRSTSQSFSFFCLSTFSFPLRTIFTNFSLSFPHFLIHLSQFVHINRGLLLPLPCHPEAPVRQHALRQEHITFVFRRLMGLSKAHSNSRTKAVLRAITNRLPAC